MALDTTTSAAPSNSTAALAQAWINDIHNALVGTGSGWTQTSDTGQTAMPYTGAAPTATNTVVAKAVYQMSGSPSVFMILEFGSGGAASAPSVWITICSATNGASSPNPGAQTTTRRQISPGGSETTLRACKHSLDTDRCGIWMFADTTANNMYIWFGVERIRDSSGAVSDGSTTRQGVYVVGGAAATSFSQALELGVPTQIAAPTLQSGVANSLGIAGPASGGTLYNNTASLLPMRLFLGEELPAPTIFMGFINSDIPVLPNTIVNTVYGTSRNYFVSSNVASIQTSPQNIYLAMRYG